MNKNKIISVTIGYTLEPQLCFNDGKIFFNKKLDKLFYPEYFLNDCKWPIDPVTEEKLPIV